MTIRNTRRHKLFSKFQKSCIPLCFFCFNLHGITFRYSLPLFEQPDHPLYRWYKVKRNWTTLFVSDVLKPQFGLREEMFHGQVVSDCLIRVVHHRNEHIEHYDHCDTVVSDEQKIRPKVDQTAVLKRNILSSKRKNLK